MPTGIFRIQLADLVRLARGPADGAPVELLPADVTLDRLLAAGADALAAATSGPADGPVPPGAGILAPVETQEVWAAGVTYLRSRDARIAESVDSDSYARVYSAERPEVFFKAAGWRARGPGQPIAVRGDSSWDAPEPELALVLDSRGEIAGYTIGNDVSSRSIEGENPLYLPQAKIFDGSCAVGPAIVPAGSIDPPFAISVAIERDGTTIYRDTTTTAQMKRTFDDLRTCLFASLAFPVGAILMTGTCLVPPVDVTLTSGDVVTVAIAGLGELRNTVR